MFYSGGGSNRLSDYGLTRFSLFLFLVFQLDYSSCLLSKLSVTDGRRNVFLASSTRTHKAQIEEKEGVSVEEISGEKYIMVYFFPCLFSN